MKTIKKRYLFLFFLLIGNIIVCNHAYKFTHFAKAGDGTMKETMEKRFQAMGLPSFPAADILLLYGGLLNGFNAFKHNPRDYAKELSIPTLLLHGNEDKRVLVSEVKEIFENIKGEKRLKILETCGHEVYLKCAEAEWKKEVREFCLEK